MTFPSGAIATYNVGSNANQRDVSDYVTNVSPSDSPFFSMIGQSVAVARLKEEMTDSLNAANGGNALVEGDQFTNTTATQRGVEANYTQIFTKVIQVTETQEVVDKYGGIKSEMTYQTKQRYKELATDVESAFITGTSASGTTAAARKLNGLVAKITTNTATASTASALWTGSAAADLTAFEDKLNDLFQTMWGNGVQPDTVLVGGSRKRRISKLTTGLTRYIGADEMKQSLVVNVYDSDFGTINVMLNRYVPAQYVLAVASSMWTTAYLRRFKQFPLAKTTDSTQVAIVGELTLSGKTEKGAGKITGS